MFKCDRFPAESISPIRPVSPFPGQPGFQSITPVRPSPITESVPSVGITPVTPTADRPTRIPSTPITEYLPVGRRPGRVPSVGITPTAVVGGRPTRIPSTSITPVQQVPGTPIGMTNTGGGVPIGMTNTGGGVPIGMTNTGGGVQQYPTNIIARLPQPTRQAILRQTASALRGFGELGKIINVQEKFAFLDATAAGVLSNEMLRLNKVFGKTQLSFPWTIGGPSGVPAWSSQWESAMLADDSFINGWSFIPSSSIGGPLSQATHKKSVVFIGDWASLAGRISSKAYQLGAHVALTAKRAGFERAVAQAIVARSQALFPVAVSSALLGYGVSPDGLGAYYFP